MPSLFTFLLVVLAAWLTQAVPVEEDWKYAVGWDGTVLPATAIGTPLNATLSGINSRSAENLGGVYICTAINWGGTCGYAVQPLNTCIVLGSDWNNLISSFGPDNCNRCFAFDDAHCALPGVDSWIFEYPGDATGGLSYNPGPINGPWNDKISSFSCYQIACS